MCQARFQVLHRPHLNPWTCAFWPSVTHSADYLRQFHFPSVFVDPLSVSLFVLVVTLNDYSHDSVDPRMLNLHLSPELPEAGSAELWKEVQQVLAAGWHAEMNAEVLAHAIWIFCLFWSDLYVQLLVVVQLMLMTDS